MDESKSPFVKETFEEKERNYNLIVKNNIRRLETLNRHFVSVGPKLARRIQARPGDNCLQHITPINEEMLLRTVDKKYVMNAINQLKKGKASGPDKVATTLVKKMRVNLSINL